MAALTFDTLVQRATGAQPGAGTLDAQAMQHTLADLIETLRMTRGRLQALVASWSDAQLHMQPPTSDAAASDEDRWSATMAISHLLATQNWYLLHIGRLLGRREHFDLMPRGLGDHARNDLTRAELIDQLRAATDQLLTTLTEIPADADLAATRDSTFFGDLSLRGWAYLATLHDVQHYEQIERLRALPGFPAA